MSGKVLGDYVGSPIPEALDDALNHDSGDAAYMVLRSETWEGSEYGEPSFATTLGKAHSDADWAGTAGKRAIVVDLAGTLQLRWDLLPVLYDNTEED